MCSAGLGLLGRRGLWEISGSIPTTQSIPESKGSESVSFPSPCRVPADFRRLSYIAFLDMLRHGKLERTLDAKDKSTPAYAEYAQTLYTYLLSFFERALPLIDIRQKIKEATEDFETAWEAGRVPGWDEGSGKPVVKAAQANGSGIWCEYCACLSGLWQHVGAHYVSYRSKALLEAHCL
jgi:hypothetical protein